MKLTGEPVHTRIPIVFNDAETDVTMFVVGAMLSARIAQNSWSRTSLADRLKLVRELRRLIAEHASWLAEASASARHRPALESLLAEVLPLAEACRFLEREAEKTLRPRRYGRRGLPLWLTGVRSEIHRDPHGVVLIIGPGNYPLLLPGAQLIQALVAGNAVLLKPGVGGTVAASKLVELIVRAGFDPKLIAVLPESSAAARIAIAARPDKVIFTGSAATGEIILGQLAEEIIPATMELSGCDAVIVRDDADFDLVVKALTFGLTLNNGATCMAPKRVFISAAKATELEGRLARALAESSRFQVLSSKSDAGFRPLIEEAARLGAHLIAGEISDDGTAVMPLVLGGVSPSSQLLHADIFASVLALVTVADDNEAVQRTNDCPYALAASIFSRDESVARALATRINAGSVCINDLIVPTADARLPFGGRGRSGFGSTRGAEGLLELTTPKVITISRSKFRPAFDETQPGDEQMFGNYLKLTHGRGLKYRWQALVSLIRIVSRRKKSSPEKL
jgi:acyl-CoA reductase-like NAD-dependent aldehyde dehydrogenase